MGRSLRFTGPGRVIGRGLQFAFQLLLCRFLGPSGYGIYSLSYSIVEIVKQMSLLGLQNGVVRFGAVHLADSDFNGLRGCYRASRKVTLVSSFAFGTVLWVLAKPLAVTAIGQPALEWPLKLFALSLPFDTWLVLSQFWSRALRRAHIDVLLADLVQPGLAILLGVVALALGTGLHGSVVAYGASCVLALCLGIGLLAQRFKLVPVVAQTRYDIMPLLRASAPMLLVGFSYALMGHIDKLMIGHYLDAAAVGIYTAAFRLSRQVGLVQTAFVPIFAPLVSGLHHRKSSDDLGRVYSLTSRWVLTCSLPVFVLMTVFGDVVLRLYGKGFEEAWLLLAILTMGQLINLAGGLAMQVLQMAGHQNDDLAIITGGLLATAVLNLVLVPAYGTTGAAVGTAVAFAMLSLTRLFVVRWRLGLWPYSREFIPPIIACVVAAVVGVALRSATSGTWMAVAAACISLVVYAGMVWRHGITADERVALAGFLRFSK